MNLTRRSLNWSPLPPLPPPPLLPQSSDALLCGRVLLFLAKLLPLTERSGVNLGGAFNTDNATPVEEVPEVGVAEGWVGVRCVYVWVGVGGGRDAVERRALHEALMVALVASSSLAWALAAHPPAPPALPPALLQGAVDSEGRPVDAALYRTFWGLQGYFRCGVAGRPGGLQGGWQGQDCAVLYDTACVWCSHSPFVSPHPSPPTPHPPALLPPPAPAPAAATRPRRWPLASGARCPAIYDSCSTDSASTRWPLGRARLVAAAAQVGAV